MPEDLKLSHKGAKFHSVRSSALLTWPSVAVGYIELAVSTQQLGARVLAGLAITLAGMPLLYAQSAGVANLDSCTSTMLRPVLTEYGVPAGSPPGFSVGLTGRLVDNCSVPVANAAVIVSFSDGDAPIRLSYINDGIYESSFAGNLRVSRDCQQQCDGAQQNPQLPANAAGIGLVEIAQLDVECGSVEIRLAFDHLPQDGVQVRIGLSGGNSGLQPAGSH